MCLRKQEVLISRLNAVGSSLARSNKAIALIGWARLASKWIASMIIRTSTSSAWLNQASRTSFSTELRRKGLLNVLHGAAAKMWSVALRRPRE